MRVLVLTPTNKAADVLARKIVECSGDVTECRQWLVRFGLTGDGLLEESGVYRDKTFDYTSMNRSVTITTIARYPYDYFMTQDGHVLLRDMDWDYVVFDEASMISCAQITYPLNKARPRKFMIAGDPHQIAPVVKADLWKDENIYTMVKLDSFRNPSTVPHAFKVTLLETQYRSVPAIGSVYSEFSYQGMVKPYRDDEGVDRSYLGKELGSQAISVIRFPVSSYESIYKAKTINYKSSYQPYSALLSYEIIRSIGNRVLAEQLTGDISIGVVSPYRAQADLISGLLTQVALPSNVTVQAGTIHGFQGDECDVMIVVLNTPPSISKKRSMFLNQTNILNVSVSRARDSLILLMPDEKTKDVGWLYEVNRLRNLCIETGDIREFASSEIETSLFGEASFIEANCFTTGHHSVNVYGRPEQRYEIRSEKQAVDIQVYGDLLKQDNLALSDDVSEAGQAENKSVKLPPSKNDGQTTKGSPTQHNVATQQRRQNQPREWTDEETQRLRDKYTMFMNLPRSLAYIIPGRTMREIDAKAVELGLIGERKLVALGRGQSVPVFQKETVVVRRMPSAAAPVKGKQNRKRRGHDGHCNAPWRAEEIGILKRNYPIYGSDVQKWDKQLMYRRKKDIEEEAKRLGLS